MRKAQQKTGQAPAKVRQSGVELLRIIAILLIVTSHVVQTLRSESPLCC